jgi:membrane protein DedA with SNARE-associated domain
VARTCAAGRLSTADDAAVGSGRGVAVDPSVAADWVVALVGSPWVFVVLWLLTAVDGFFPPVPSETAVIALAAVSAATGRPELWLVVATAALGAFAGDQIAYTIGRRLPLHRVPVLRGERAVRALGRARLALGARGASYIIAARFVPVGRVAVNMTAGAVGYSRRRFTVLAAFGSVVWAVYSAALGIGAGMWLHDHPVAAAVAGVVVGLVLGVVVDAVLRRALQRFQGRVAGRATSSAGRPAPVEPVAPFGPTGPVGGGPTQQAGPADGEAARPRTPAGT